MQKPEKTKFFTLRRLLLPVTAILLVLFELLAVLPKTTAPLERVELSIRDSFLRLRGIQPPHEAIVIVAVDDFSINWTGYQWPWPRAYEAEIVNWLVDAGARVIGLDFMLFEEGNDPAGNQALADALGRAPYAIAVSQIFTDESQGTVTLKLPLPVLRDSLDGIGLTEVVSDDDAIVRSFLAYRYFQRQVYYNWAFQVAALYLGAEGPSNPTATSLTFNGQDIPLTGGRLLVNYAGPAKTYEGLPGTGEYFSAASVVLGDYPAEAFRDKIVLIGATTPTLQDLYPTPFSAVEQTAGVEIVANAVATILTGSYLHTLPPWAGMLIIIGMAVIAVLINRSPRPTLNVAVMAAGMVVYAVAAFVIFARSRWYLPVTGPELMLFLGVVLPTLEQAVSQEMEKRRVRGMFTRFISPEMVNQLLATQDINSLNKRATLTILFSDIRGFTTLSEKLVPEEVVSLLNPYLEVMTEVVHKHGGTVDKYEGDAIVAFFGEPVPYEDHALRAARAAVEMRVALAELKERWRKEGRLPARFEIGIGLNTGEAFVGLLGSAQRINYTVIGDNVNLAARLQDLSKIYFWPIIISESTAEAIKEEFDVEFIEAASIKGRSEPVKIYKVLGRKGAPESERIQPLDLG